MKHSHHDDDDDDDDDVEYVCESFIKTGPSTDLFPCLFHCHSYVYPPLYPYCRRDALFLHQHIPHWKLGEWVTEWFIDQSQGCLLTLLPHQKPQMCPVSILRKLQVLVFYIHLSSDTLLSLPTLPYIAQPNFTQPSLRVLFIIIISSFSLYLISCRLHLRSNISGFGQLCD